MEADEFWQQVKTNPQAGRVRLLIVADIIPPELRRIVEFLNSQMDPAEVLAVEIRHYVGQGLKTLVPRVIGQTAEAEAKKRGTNSPRQRPTEETLTQFAENTGKGPLYQACVDRLKKEFDTGFYGSGICFTTTGGDQKVLNVLAFFPDEKQDEEGLVTQIWINSFAEISKRAREEVIANLPKYWGKPSSSNGVAKMLVRSVEELNQILDKLKP